MSVILLQLSCHILENIFVLPSYIKDIFMSLKFLDQLYSILKFSVLKKSGQRQITYFVKQKISCLDAYRILIFTFPLMYKDISPKNMQIQHVLGLESQGQEHRAKAGVSGARRGGERSPPTSIIPALSPHSQPTC